MDNDPLWEKFGIKRPSSSRKSESILSDEDYARLHAYWMPDLSSLAVPAEAIFEACKEVAKRGWKVKIYGGRGTSLHVIMPGVMAFHPAFCPLGTKTYDIDRRYVVVNKGRILRARAKVWPWKVSFEARWIPGQMGGDFDRGETLPKLLAEAGFAQGILDGRKKGFGRFRVVAIGKVEEVDSGLFD